MLKVDRSFKRQYAYSGQLTGVQVYYFCYDLKSM